MLSCAITELKILEISSTSLKNLALDSIVGGNNSGNYKLKIACPNLLSFNYIVLFPSLPHFAFESLNSLQNAFINLDDFNEDDMENERCHVLSTIFNEFREVKVLKLLEIVLQILNLDLAHEEPACFYASFNNLKSLILYGNLATWLMPSVIRLLNCSPNLEALAIYFPTDGYGSSAYPKISKKAAISCLTYHHPKTVEIKKFCGRGSQHEIVRFLLKNGHVLQRMSIRWVPDIENRGKIISRMMKFPRSSSSVALKFPDPKRVYDFSDYLFDDEQKN